MTRPGTLAIALGIAIVSASLVIVLYTVAGLAPPAALAWGAVTALVLAFAQWRSARAGERLRLIEEISAMRAENARLAADLQTVRAELPALDEAAKRAEAAERAMGALLDEALGPALDERISRQIDTGKASLVGEMRVIESLVKQFIENQTKARQQEMRQAELRQAELRQGEQHQAKAAPAIPPQVARQMLSPSNDAGSPLARLSNVELLSRVRHAIADNRIDIYLQPIVTLPQRKVRFYEALVRLRDEEGDPILPGDYARVARDAGLMPVLDNLLLLRSNQIVRQMTRRNKQFKMFCNLSPETLGDMDHFPQFLDHLEQNKDLVEHLVFEVAQGDLKAAGPLELDNLATLREHGYRFSMDHVHSLDIDARELAQRGFKFVKISASLLLDGGLTVKTHIHPADMASLFSRYGIDLIAEKVEAETEVVNLLDLDLSLGQGYLFAEPKQVRVGNANLEDLLAARKTG